MKRAWTHAGKGSQWERATVLLVEYPSVKRQIHTFRSSSVSRKALLASPCHLQPRTKSCYGEKTPECPYPWCLASLFYKNILSSLQATRMIWASLPETQKGLRRREEAGLVSRMPRSYLPMETFRGWQYNVTASTEALSFSQLSADYIFPKPLKCSVD